MNTKRFSLRFNLDREDDRRAWEALHRMDTRSINQEIIARINAKEQTDVFTSSRNFSVVDGRLAIVGINY